MKRRKFIKQAVSAGLLTALPAAGFSRLMGTQSVKTGAAYDMVAIKGGLPAAMFDKAIAAMGGMGAFVKKGQTVVVKPNIGWDKTPEYAANTHPELVKQVIKHCFMAGAKSVHVFDHTCNQWDLCYTNSGIEKAAKDAGAKVVPGNTESYYQEIKVEKGKTLKSAKVHELILESDVFINVPVLKNHGGAKLSMALKNLMGSVWSRGIWHRSGLDQCIADFATFRNPDLNILDAYNVMMQNGPQGVSPSDVVNMKSLLISTNMVAIDTAGAKLFGMDPTTIGHIVKAEEAGIGSMDLSKLNIKKFTA